MTAMPTAAAQVQSTGTGGEADTLADPCAGLEGAQCEVCYDTGASCGPDEDAWLSVYFEYDNGPVDVRACHTSNTGHLFC